MSNWENKRLEQVLKRADRFEPRNNLQEYVFAGTYSYARGIFVGERKSGSSFNLDKVQRIHAGDFVYCKIMAWEGAFGVVPDAADDCVMSGAFVAYEIDHTQVEPRFLEYYFKIDSVWHAIGDQSTGTNVRRRSLHPTQFESTEIPLPSLDEQRRIVAHIDALAARIAEARGLRLGAVAEAQIILRAILLGPAEWQPEHTPLDDLLQLRDCDVYVDPQESYTFAGVYSFGRGVFVGTSKQGSEFAYSRLTRVHQNDFVYPKLMAWEGALGIVPPECDGLVVSPEFPVFQVRDEHVLPELLDFYFKLPETWSHLSKLSTGTNVRRRRLNPKEFLSYRFPLPPKQVQLQFSQIKRQIDKVQNLHHMVLAELDALLPSVLDRAFKGEL